MTSGEQHRRSPSSSVTMNDLQMSSLVDPGPGVELMRGSERAPDIAIRCDTLNGALAFTVRNRFGSTS
ncbi:hypothetical protein ABIB82_007527 [Bradyrhizobium sp. i1.8.4]